MQIKKGIPVSPGVAICEAVVIDAEHSPIPRRLVPSSQTRVELERLDRALVTSIKEIESLRERATATLGPELAKLFSAHLGMLQDKAITGEIRGLITRERVTAEYAVYSVMREWARRFQSLESKHFRDRDADIWDLERRLVGHLIGTTRADLTQMRGEAIVIAHDLTPSQTASFDKRKIRGLATDLGGRTSHTAIMAHALGIPAIVGLEDITSAASVGQTVIIDGNRGLVIIDPDASQLMEYRQDLERRAAFDASLDELSRLPAITTDGTEITLLANIEFPDEIAAAVQKGANGVGLYRTEFLFLTAGAEPSEDQQYEAYKQAILALGGKMLTIRTLDLGADKLLGDENADHIERNPFLGCRSIRLCLQDLPLFKTQLRAILRASVEGPVRIMFPLISNIRELRQAKMILNDVREDLEDEGIPFRRDIPVGIMIEVPSAALQAKALAHECQFFSIGTNDLIQYTVAVDRGNERIASLYSAAHPAVIQLVREVVKAAKSAKIEVSLCGEMGGEPEFVMLLLGLGLRSLSITPPAVPEVKRIIRSVSIGQCTRIAKKIMAFDSDREVMNYLREELRKIIPDESDGRSIET
ncbi:MAG: phosphoenolpyruvate--protein phosphotransferase [Phycisphaeraceae bacterium]|nr:phosphoenolpyruvate--protein phosphotransferase [Phycisphaeraceae bacterium]